MGGDWIKDAIFYQIYPQSFCDKNGDGIGDIQGIISKLDYLLELGVNAVWLNPMYESKFGDAGYDVTDYKKIAKRYGSLEDFKELLSAAKTKGIKIIMDFVPGHTSASHPWFLESQKPEKNEYTNRFVWSDSVWKAGQSMIKGYSDRDGSYMYNFFYFQPKLNYGFQEPKESWQLPFEHPDVQKTVAAMIDNIRFWLDIGIDGLRIDMAGTLVVGDTSLTSIKKLWSGVRKMFDEEYKDAVMLSEWGIPIDAVNCGFHADFLLRSGTKMYTPLFRKEPFRNGVFSAEGASIFDPEAGGDISEFSLEYSHHLNGTKGKGYFIMPTGSHDMPRLNNKRTEEELKVMFAFIFTLPTIPIIYYGDEIAMRYIEGLVSKEGGYNRTGSRTPMQWDSSKNMGFSGADKSRLYLPVDQDGETVESQRNKKNSLFNISKDLIKLRKEVKALGNNGDYTPLAMNKNDYPFTYIRSFEEERYFIIINPCNKNYKFPNDYKEIKETYKVGGINIDSEFINISPLSAAVLKIER